MVFSSRHWHYSRYLPHITTPLLVSFITSLPPQRTQQQSAFTTVTYQFQHQHQQYTNKGTLTSVNLQELPAAKKNLIPSLLTTFNTITTTKSTSTTTDINTTSNVSNHYYHHHYYHQYNNLSKPFQTTISAVNSTSFTTKSTLLPLLYLQQPPSPTPSITLYVA